MNKEEYNNIPVHYCRECLSLKIKTIAQGLNLDYCDECGGTDIVETQIEDWEKLFKESRGFEFLTSKI